MLQIKVQNYNLVHKPIRFNVPISQTTKTISTKLAEDKSLRHILRHCENGLLNRLLPI